MLKKLLSMFNKNKERNSLKVSKEEFTKEVSAVSRQKVCTVQEKVDDEVFTVDFVSIRESGETIKKAEVIFPANNQYIIINGEKTYFDAYYVRDEGMSSDNLYHRIATLFIA